MERRREEVEVEHIGQGWSCGQSARLPQRRYRQGGEWVAEAQATAEWKELSKNNHVYGYASGG